jgi:sugar/nucleoside kinase (ribokinase family)
MPIIVFGNILADLNLFISRFPIQAQDLHTLQDLDVGLGGACNVAIMAARLGLPVAGMGEVGDDRFGRLVVDGLRREGVDLAHVLVTQEAQTPVAVVLVDESGEPAYLGFRGRLTQFTLPPAWRAALAQARALFVDGWAEFEGAPAMALEAVQVARRQGVPIFFDPGPGNPNLDNGWHTAVAGHATVLLLNEGEAARLSGLEDLFEMGPALLALGPELVIIKRGARGCALFTRKAVFEAPGFTVPLVDATGAGDSLAGAVMHGYLRGLPLADLGALANAAGAAKVQKRGTGHNVPTRAEVRAVLQQSGHDPALA